MLCSFYPTIDDVEALHAFMMEGFDREPEKLTEPGELESALMRARNAAIYEDADLATQTARMMLGISTAHGYLDGNKRTATIVADTFVQNNDFWIACHAIELGWQLVATVRHDQSEDEFTGWIRERLVPLSEYDPAIAERMTYTFTIDITGRQGLPRGPEYLSDLTIEEHRLGFREMVERSWSQPLPFEYQDHIDQVRIFIYDEIEPGMYECRAIGRPVREITEGNKA